MDYTKLVTAIKKGSGDEFRVLYTDTFKILCSYLRSTMRANHQDAEDCAQHAIMNAVERIQSNAIREPESIYSYMLQSARNRYLRIQYENKRSNYQDNMEPYVPILEQIDALVDQEEQKALDECLESLSEESRSFIDYWLSYPDIHAGDIAEEMGISVNNVWIRKHRIVKKLADCVRKKLGKKV